MPGMDDLSFLRSTFDAQQIFANDLPVVPIFPHEPYTYSTRQ
jgi:hypothetical protein